jgi:hypothetical protein
MPELTDAQLDDQVAAIFNRPRKGPGARAACGTPAGYYRHKREGNTPCDACRKANTEAKNADYNAPVKRPRQLKPIEHGTPQGARKHYYRKEQPCEACRVAYNADLNARKRSRRAAKRRADS